MSKKLQKIVSITTSVATIAWISGIGMLAPMAAQAVTINEGDTIKTADNPDVYIAKYVGSKKFKRLILNPQVFESYRHLSWSAIKTVSQAELDAFTTSDLVRADGDYKVYKLTPNGDVGTKQWLNITAETFTADGYDWDSIYTINNVDRDNYTTGAEITDGVSSGTLQVGLSASTQPATTIVDASAVNPLASFTFTAPSTSAVKVTTFKVKRIGVSADTSLTAVYLYDGNSRITDSATVSSNIVTWNNTAGVFTVPAGTTKTITVKSDVDGTSGETLGVAIIDASYVTTDGATVSGTFPINGNIHSIATGTLAGVSFATDGGTYATPATDGAPDPQNEFTVWQSITTITTRAVYLNYITFRQIGSVSASDVANFKLLVDGTQVGSTVAAMDSSGYVSFDLTSSPKKLEAGAKTFKVLMDIVGGSTRTTSLSLRYAADAIFTDSEYGSTVLIQKDSAAFGALSSNTQTIGAGSLTVTKTSDSPSVSVVKDASQAVLAKYEFRAAGESIKVENLSAAVNEDDNHSAFTLRNAGFFVDNIQVGSTFNLKGEADTTATTTVNLGSSLVIVPGTPKIVEIRADIYDNDGTNDVAADDTLQVILIAGSNNAQRMTSLTYFNAPTSATNANTLTVKTGAMSLAKYTGYADQTAVAPKTTYKVAEWRLTSETTEAINLTTLDVDWNGSANCIEVDTSLASGYYITYADKTTTTKTTVTSTSDSFTINYSLPAGQTISIALYAVSIPTTITGTLRGDLTVTGTTAQSATAVTGGETNGQTITWGSGSISTAATEDPLDNVVYGGQQKVTAAKYELIAANETYYLKEFAIQVVDGSQALIDRVYLYDSTDESTPLYAAGQPMNANYSTTTGLNLQIPANTTKTIVVKLDLNNIGTAYASSGLNASTTLVSALFADSQGAQSYVNDAREGNKVLAYKTYPVVTHVQLASADRVIVNGASQAVYSFKIAPSAGGVVTVKQIKIDLTWNDVGAASSTLELEAVKFYRGSTDITSIVTTVDDDAVNVEDATGVHIGHSKLTISWPTEESISSETTYTIKAIPREFDKSTTSSDSVVLQFSTDSEQVATIYTRYAINPPGTGIWTIGANGATQGTAGTAANFIWSDKAVVGHSGVSSSSTADWYNGYLIDNLSLDSTTMSM